MPIAKEYDLPIWDLTLDRVAGDLSAKQFYLVKLSGTTTVALGAAATNELLGVLQNKPTTTADPPTIRMLGLSKCVAGAAVAVGAKVTSDSAGKGVTAAPSAGVTNCTVGYALTSAAADGDIFTVCLTGPYLFQTAD